MSRKQKTIQILFKNQLIQVKTIYQIQMETYLMKVLKMKRFRIRGTVYLKKFQMTKNSEKLKMQNQRFLKQKKIQIALMDQKKARVQKSKLRKNYLKKLLQLIQKMMVYSPLKVEVLEVDQFSYGKLFLMDSNQKKVRLLQKL